MLTWSPGQRWLLLAGWHATDESGQSVVGRGGTASWASLVWLDWAAVVAWRGVACPPVAWRGVAWWMKEKRVFCGSRQERIVDQISLSIHLSIEIYLYLSIGHGNSLSD